MFALDVVKQASNEQDGSWSRIDVGICFESVRDRESMAFGGLTEKWPNDQDFFKTGKAE